MYLRQILHLCKAMLIIKIPVLLIRPWTIREFHVMFTLAKTVAVHDIISWIIKISFKRSSNGTKHTGLTLPYI